MIGNGVSENDEAGATQCVTLDLVTPGVAPKTPVSLLQEMAAKQGSTPKYDLLQVEGAVHEPTFLYRATVGEVVASGLGQSKKKAKHMAARAVLDQLLGQRASAPVVPPLALPAPAPATAAATASPAPPALPPPAPQLVLPYDDGIPGNPVGQLQELCMSRRWPPPTYELVREEGLPHERTFTIACCIGTNNKEIGVGKSKKIAKRQASSLMLTKRDNSPEDGVSIMDNDDDQIAQKMTAHYSGLRDSWAPKAASQSGLRVSQFHCSLKASCGQLITELQVSPASSSQSCRSVRVTELQVSPAISSQSCSHWFRLAIGSH
ncbi:RISC-loading complex subunit TARBP2-like [Pollicipes pollicipes]|uniref:RISC-loading complex subunit TARBP2-like n=1 Tax=Pollicipes pollicipes TaxID=41117 RepID=UPI00188506A3|nr:RISC-loading complex subunit TARBP2-like [Pollicipes pollicipes]